VAQNLHTVSWSKRKRWNKKGFSSIIGAIFMIMIVGILASSYFVFSLSQNTVYNLSVRENNQLEINLISESINVTAEPEYTSSTNNVRVTADLQNDGSIYVQIKTLWVHSVSTDHYGFVDGLNIKLLPGQSQTITQDIGVAGASAGEEFYGWIITGRGKTIGLYPAHQTGPAGEKGDAGEQGVPGTTGPQGPEGPPSVSALVSQGIGSVSLDFDSFRVYTCDSSNNILTTSEAFTFARSSNVAFSVNVTNLDPSYMPLNLTQNSCAWIFSPAAGAIKGNVWKIGLLSDSKITPLTQSQYIVFPWNQTTTLYFGPTNAGVSSLDAGVTGVNLILTGRIGMKDYGQNLPFISLIAT
jgi:FlaG/FlaF family flagellin (archaellin)